MSEYAQTWRGRLWPRLGRGSLLRSSLMPAVPRTDCGRALSFARSIVLGVPRTACARWWWRGLDSNQRTLARADLQSAAFNHSATSPDGGTDVPQSARQMAVLVPAVNAGRRRKLPAGKLARLQAGRVAPSLALGALHQKHAPGMFLVERVKGIEPSS